MYESIRNGDVTISHEVWQSTFGKSFYNAMAKGGVIDAGTHAATTLEEMGVPTWVVDKGPVPGPAELGSAEKRRVLQELHHGRFRWQGPLARRPAKLARRPDAGAAQGTGSR